MKSTLEVNKENQTFEEVKATPSISNNNENIDYPGDKCIHDLFEEQVEKTPDNVAVVMDDDKLTYKELEEKSNQLANYLKTKGVGPETLVGICLERSLDFVIAILSILKTGGAYVPVDPRYPKDRILYIFDDSGCSVLLSHSSFKFILSGTSSKIIYYDEALPEIAKEPATQVASGVAPHNPAYIIYPPASAGKPKGVLIEHRNAVKLLFNSHFQFEEISKSLPEYMLPSFFAKTNHIPLAENGKLDNEQLTEPAIETNAAEDYAAPENDIEKALVAVWSEVLSIDQDEIGIDHNFFEIGGHSLGAATVAQHIRREFHKSITIRYIFENPTIAQLAKVIPQLEDLADENAPKTAAVSPDAKTYPLLNGQIISWLSKCVLKNKTSNVCAIFTLDGRLDFDLLQRSFTAVLKQHDSLWHAFSKKKPMIHVKEPGEGRIEFVDASTHHGSDQDVLTDDLLDRVLHSEFDLTRPPHLRVAVVKQSETKYFFLASFPHVVCDYTSINVLVAEIFEVYQARGELPADANVKTTALEMVNNEKAYMQSDDFSQGHDFWKDKLRNPKPLNVKKSYLSPPGKPQPNKLLTKILLSKESISGLQKITNQTNTSIQMAILTLLNATLYTFSGHRDISIAMIMDAREIHPKTPVINLNVGTIVVRSNLANHLTYQELLEHVKWYVIDAHNHFKIPNVVSVPVLSVLKDKPLAAAMTKLYSAVMGWRYKKTMIDKNVLTSLVAMKVGKQAMAKDLEKQNKDRVLAPDIFYNVLPNFYENRVIYSSDELVVSDLRDREKIITGKVFEENSDFFDATGLNCELLRGADDEAYLYLWGGGYTKEAYEEMRNHFLKHLSAFIDDPENEFYE